MSRARSNKAKGRNGQKEVCEIILQTFPELHADDVRSNPMGSDGEDILLSRKARELLGWVQIEVKRKKKIAACRFLEQAKAHGPYNPIAFFREDRGPWYVAMSEDHYTKLITKALKND